MGEENQFCLRWSNYQQQLGEAFRMLLEREMLVDVTLACDGRSLRAHRAVLSACSSYFQGLFQESTHSHPIVILKDVKFEELESLVHFMYNGEVTVGNDSLPGFLDTAKTLQIRGLTVGPDDVAESSKINSAASDELSNDSATEEQKTDLETVNTRSAEYFCNPKRIKTEHGTLADPTEDVQHQDDISFSVSHMVDTIGHSLQAGQADGTRSPSQFPLNQNHGLHQSVFPHHRSGTGFSARPFRHRVLWGTEQLAQLESWYAADRYPSGQTMRRYADALASLNPNSYSPTRQNVDYWFQNRRRRDSHPEVMQQREKKKMARTLWGQIMDQRMAHS
ncbi:broad-complex core protein isoforms 1/2/3/4/5-like isoform X2 [Bacillus rossius redtenbacheri]|uniref:broad-complex core protein isoforms 1/2/3/4/5-like isoform X2 n=1 Tax=Bacillus rossius redtenbacheri TaxID=93214 RepID=UPI002FDE288C